MGFLKSIKSLISRKSLSRTIGNTEPICPYCNVELTKMPKKKTKCTSCENYIYKRTRPYDNMNIIIREDQIDTIDEEWSIVNGSHDIYLMEKEREQRIHDEMKNRFGHEPDKQDVEYRVFNDRATEAELKGDWGFARNYRLDMAKNLEKRKRHELALRLYYHVCFLDLNGPNNRSGTPKNLLKEYPFFTPKDGFLAPGVIRRMKKLIGDLSIPESSCKTSFIEVNDPIYQGTPTTLSPIKAWPKLKKELFSN